MTAFWVTFGLVFVAEMGDKSQLVALAFSTIYKWWQVVLGILIATLVVHAGSVALGKYASEYLPDAGLAIGAGVAFFGFAFWTLRGDTLSGDETKIRRGWGPIALVTVAFFIAELGDKTMLLTVTLATQYDSFVGAWIGSTLGMVAADALAIAVGSNLKGRLPQKRINQGAAALFFLFGTGLIYEGFTG
ncbi:MAG TPA: hypothetical protein DHV68_04090 [Dehalococcoidia bacterium]|nr:hypothetical protein [Chloroflexota bacterium]HCI86006.1 hypothetical protein [Dehalococcoidia bacterium]